MNPTVRALLDSIQANLTKLEDAIKSQDTTPDLQVIDTRIKTLLGTLTPAVE